MSTVASLLDSLCCRQRRARRASAFSRCLLVAAGGAIAVALLGLLVPASVVPAIGTGLLVAGLLAGAIAAAMCRKNLPAAARDVDTHFQLADRTITALHCESIQPPRPVSELQVRDAMEHLRAVDPRAAARGKTYWGSLAAAIGCSAVAFGLLWLPVAWLAQPAQPADHGAALVRPVAQPTSVPVEVPGERNLAGRDTADVPMWLGYDRIIREYFLDTGAGTGPANDGRFPKE